MASITILTGSPGTGKTILAGRLAAASPRGVHLSGDVFYHFISNLVSPILPGAHAQNATVISAIARAAGAFASGGYDVVVDSVIGPWSLPAFAQELEDVRVPLHYVVLRARLEDTVRRAQSRDHSGDERIVRHMHGEFEDLGAFERHALDSSDRTTDDVFAELARRWRAGDFFLGTAGVATP